MGDHDIEGHFAQLLRFFLSPTWREFWEDLGLDVVSFASLGLAVDSPDVLVWKTCQERQVILVTGNRNYESPDSLEAAIRQYNRADSLPVFTIGDPREVYPQPLLRGTSGREIIGVRFGNSTEFCGTGRLYIP